MVNRLVKKGRKQSKEEMHLPDIRGGSQELHVIVLWVSDSQVRRKKVKLWFLLAIKCT